MSYPRIYPQSDQTLSGLHAHYKHFSSNYTIICNNIINNSCVCETGYELARGTCEDIDECLDDPCSDTERCSNIEGLFAMTVNFDQT